MVRAATENTLNDSTRAIIAIIPGILLLIVACILGLVYGRFSYTKETHEAKLGPLEFSIKDKETVNVPVWAGLATIVAGGVLLVVLRKR